MLGVTGRVPVEGAQADVAKIEFRLLGGGGARKSQNDTYIDLQGPEISDPQYVAQITLCQEGWPRHLSHLHLF